jgi:ABC-type sugar transport system ATPase subunit
LPNRHGQGPFVQFLLRESGRNDGQCVGPNASHLELAADHVVAAIHCAIVTIVTDQRFATAANTGVTTLADGAGIEVVAEPLVDGEDAAVFGVTGIVGAGVEVVAEHLIVEDTVTQGTVVTNGADVTIVTERLVDRSYAAICGVAEVVGAGVLVIARGEFIVDALAVGTVVS